MLINTSWSDDLLYHDNEIDKQHIMLFNQFGAVIDCISGDKDPECIKESAQFLLEYLSYHFRCENLLLRKSHYPEAEYHIAEHNKYISALKDILIDIMEDSEDCCWHFGLLISFSSLIGRHTNIDDAKFAKFIRN